MKTSKKYITPFDAIHFTGFKCQAKHTSIVSNAEGNFLFTRALDSQKEQDFDEALIQLNKAKHMYERTLSSSPNDKEALIQLARITRRMIEVEGLMKEIDDDFVFAGPREIEDSLAQVSFAMLDPAALMVESYFLRVFELEGEASYRFLYACFLLQGGQVQRSHDMILGLVEDYILGDHRLLPELLFALACMLKVIEPHFADVLFSRTRLILDLRDFKVKYF